MKRKRYSVEQIIVAVKQHEARATVADVIPPKNNRGFE